MKNTQVSSNADPGFFYVRVPVNTLQSVAKALSVIKDFFVIMRPYKSVIVRSSP